MKTSIQFSWTMIATAIIACLILCLSITACWQGRISEQGNITKAILNCKQVLVGLRLYASDHEGFYPDHKLDRATSSNQVFRVLFTEEVLDSEVIFGCPISPFSPDGAIGTSPDFLRALQKAENHWAMTKGMNSSLSGGTPLVYESPAAATWPPLWNADAAEKAVKGRSWRGGKIIIGQNDSAVSLYALNSTTGTAVGLKLRPDGKDLFEAAIDPEKFPKGEILDVAQ